jgi:phosphopantothenoylcysteine synthetase/decarboxylase
MPGKQEIAGWKWNTQPAMQHLSLARRASSLIISPILP